MDIQKAFEEYWQRQVGDSGQWTILERMAACDAYKAGIDSVECCGCYKWLEWDSAFDAYACDCPDAEIAHLHKAIHDSCENNFEPRRK